jgi:hypothetical protein
MLNSQRRSALQISIPVPIKSSLESKESTSTLFDHSLCDGQGSDLSLKSCRGDSRMPVESTQPREIASFKSRTTSPRGPDHEDMSAQASETMSRLGKRTLEVDGREGCTASVIWLHSLGDTGDFFGRQEHGLDLADVLAVPWCRFIFPTAADHEVTVHGVTSRQPAWFHYVSYMDERGDDHHGIYEAAERVLDLVRREIQRGIPAHRIVLAGFGQVRGLSGCANARVKGLSKRQGPTRPEIREAQFATLGFISVRRR